MDRLDAVLQEIREMAAPTEALPSSRRAHAIPKPLRYALPALGLGMAVAILGFHRTSPDVSPAPVVAKPPVTWLQIMERIDAHRMQAFMLDDVAPLTLADEVRSPAGAADRSILTRLRARGLRLDCNPMHIDTIVEEYRSLTGDTQRVGLRVTDHLEMHHFIDKRGAVIETGPARGQRTWKVELRRTDGQGRWRLFSAVPALQRSVPSSRPGN